MQMKFYDTLKEYGLVPIVVIDAVEAALPLADALTEGGLPLAQVAMVTDAAGGAIAAIRDARPDFLVGAGTVMSADELGRALEAGAQFVGATGLHAGLAGQARAAELPFYPSVATPTEVEQALELGLDTMGFFPAGAMGGVQALSAFNKTYAHRGARFIPIGGITEDNLRDYLAQPLVCACGGTWLATREDIREKQWDKIASHCALVRSIVAELRGLIGGD